MKRFTFFSLLTLAIPFAVISQNQNVIIDDVYFNTGNSKTTSQADKNQTNNLNQRPNYKNGAQEIVYKERNVKKPTVIRDTVYVVGQASDEKSNRFSSDFNLSNWDGKTNPVIVHDTIYVSENVAENFVDSLKSNQEQGYYLNGFNGNESDKEYAERIRRFHNPRYTIFIGDPRYNDIFFLNNFDWNVYVDGTYAYVTPTWTNPYWWNYEYSSMGFGGFGYGWHSPFYSGYGGYYDPWGYGGFYGYGSMYGYGNYWDPYGYGYGYDGYYGNYYGYGSGGYWNGYSHRNKNYDEGTRRATSNYNNNASNRLGGTRTEGANSSVIGGGYNSTQSRNPYTVVNGRTTNAASGTSTRTNLNLNSRTVSNPVNGIGIVRNSTNRTVNINQNVNGTNTDRNSTSINTRPRTYTTTTTNVPTGNYTPRSENSGNSSFRGSSSTITRSTTSSGGNATYTPSRGSYSTRSSTESTRSSSPSFSSGGSSYTGGNSGSSTSSSSSSSSGGGGSRSSSGGSGGGRR